MRTIHKLSLLLFVTLTITIAGCKRICDIGYEGKHCLDEVRIKYLGRFEGSRTCETTSGTDSVFISTVDADVTKVIIRNLNNQPKNTTGTVQTDGTLLITDQIYGSGAHITGAVKIEADKIKINYTLVYDSPDSTTKNCLWIQN
jgi:hypothetical protein